MVRSSTSRAGNPLHGPSAQGVRTRLVLLPTAPALPSVPGSSSQGSASAHVRRTRPSAEQAAPRPAVCRTARYRPSARVTPPCRDCASGERSPAERRPGLDATPASSARGRSIGAGRRSEAGLAFPRPGARGREVGGVGRAPRRGAQPAAGTEIGPWQAGPRGQGSSSTQLELHCRKPRRSHGGAGFRERQQSQHG